MLLQRFRRYAAALEEASPTPNEGAREGLLWLTAEGDLILTGRLFSRNIQIEFKLFI